MDKDRNICSILNALSAIGLTLVNGLLGIIVTRFIILYYGSDFNGLNSTTNQIVNVLLILEGGFTLASNVALFSPISKHDYLLTNGVLSSTKNKFQKIGGMFFCIGIIVAISYTLTVNSALPRELIFTILMMTVLPQAFNLFYATTYRVVLQTQQKEYIINFITMLTIGLGHLTNIFAIILKGPMWMVRFITMMYSIINSLTIIGYVKKKEPFIDLSVLPRDDMIKGTNDVMVQKVTGVIYNSAPIVFLSLSPAGGTMLASVYAVYNNVFTMIKSLLHSIIDAPRLGFGQMLVEKKRDDIWETFKQYEYIALLAIFSLLTTTYVLILPFIDIYTVGVDDISYFDPVIALLMVIISSVEMLHIPSGHLINMAGEFKVSKNFQIIACVLLVITMFVGGNLWGIYGMLIALLTTAISLAVMEMGYIHKVFFKNKLKDIAILVFPFILIGCLLCYLESKLGNNINSFSSFITFAFFYFTINSIVAFMTSLLFCNQLARALLARLKLLCKMVKAKLLNQNT